MSQFDEPIAQLLRSRRIASLATTNPDGSPHLTAVWYLAEGESIFIATSSRSRKARNVAEPPRAALMLDVRTPGRERGVTAIGVAELLTDVRSGRLNRLVHQRYLRAAAFDDVQVGPVFAAVDDATIALRPERWLTWDMAALDRQVFGGRVASYLLPLDEEQT
jgi:PPOX class probable F420-dependent enzyme